MDHPNRVTKRLPEVLAVSFTLCYRWEEKQEKKQGVKPKTHGLRAKSVFRQDFESPLRLLKSLARYAAETAAFFDLVLRLPLLGNFII